MVDKKLDFLSKNEKYAVVLKTNPLQNIEHSIVYVDGKELSYGDPAEIFGVLNLEGDFFPFMNSAIAENQYIKEHYGFIFGYRPSDYDNTEIKQNDVRVYYAGVENTISKIDFYELCLLLCKAKLEMQNRDEKTKDELRLVKTQLEEKVKIA